MLHRGQLWCAVCLLLTWLGGSFWFLWQQSQPLYGPFDPEGLLNQLPPRLPSTFAAEQARPSEQRLIAVLAPDCYCSRAARRHLAELAERTGLTIEERTPAQMSQSGLALPATPALLWWRDDQLWYAGPLASGMACSSAGDLLLPLLLGQQVLPGPWFNSETLACRCPSRSPA